MKILGVSNPSIMYPKDMWQCNNAIVRREKKEKREKTTKKKTNTILMPFQYRINK